MSGLLHDIRYAIRQLRKSTGFAIAAVLTLALAIGANAVVFSALNALILRPLNVPKQESLYAIGRTTDIWGYESYPNYIDLRDRNHSFEAIAADNISSGGLDTGEGPTSVWLYETSGNYFNVMGLRPYLGRFYSAADEHGPNSAPYIVLTYAYWHAHFHDDKTVVGRVVQLNKHPFTIVGIAPPAYGGTFIAFSADLFVPIVNQEQVDGQDLLNERGTRWVSEVIGHLKPGVTRAQAVADLNSIGAYIEKSYPREVSNVSFSLSRPGIADTFGGAVRAFLTGLMLLAGLILLAACANLGSLFTARAADRSRSIAVRLALGATRGRILRGLFTEAVLVSLVGGVIGLWGSVFLLHALSTWRPFPEFPLNVPIAPDARVYVVALLLALASGFLFGAAPVRLVLQTDPYQVIKAGSSDRSGRRLSLRDLLLGLQIAICAVLVTSSFVAIRGLVRSMHAKIGFEPHNAMLIDTDLKKAGYKTDQISAMQKRMIETMQTIPGVTSVGLVGQDPPLHMGWADADVFAGDATDLRPSNSAGHAMLYSVSPEYFQAAGTTLISGRTFNWHDDKNSPLVAVVNVRFAEKLFGSPAKALGRYFKRHDGTKAQVVGIVEDGKYTVNLAEDPTPAMFFPLQQVPSHETWLVLRSNTDPQQLAAAARNTLRQLDPGLPAFIQTWSTEMNGALFAPRMAALSLGVLGLMGAILSITGIFGMAVYSVSKRLRELGIRMALGAQRKEILRSALGRSVKVLAFGSGAGLFIGLLATRVLAAVVYQATPRDPLVLLLVVLAMSLLGVAATWVPAQRALSVDPVSLLREE